MPYSDPIADGPVIAASYTRALRHGIRLDAILSAIRRWRTQSAGEPILSRAPVVSMVSYAIVHRHGVDRYASEAAVAGIDGLIVPDLPVEEAAGLESRAVAEGLRLIQLVTPTTPRERALRIARASTGFLYYVSVAGLTGERTELPGDLVENVAWLRTQTDLPICIGFGISRPEHVRQLAPVADGLIVGSAIVRRIHDLSEQGLARASLVNEVGRFVGDLVAALG
jgi:tryptophan synthase alpha chain